MNIGVVNETSKDEKRVGLTPGLVHTLVDKGHTIYLEKGSGDASYFSDKDFTAAGGVILESKAEVFSKADCITKVGPILREEAGLMKEKQIVFSFLHLAAQPRDIVELLLKKEITSIGFEVIEEPNGELPVVQTMSEIAGRMTVQIASHLLEATCRGMGILISGVPGVAPASVAILGAGILGTISARTFAGFGADVILLDNKIEKLRQADKMFQGRVKTMLSTAYNIQKIIQFSDVIVGSVLVPGDRAPIVITEKHVKEMRPGSVLLDFSIDQGGCIQTSRPTTLTHPYFIKHKVIHYCVPNATANVPRTATRALANVTRDYIIKVAENGIDKCIGEYTGLRNGIYTHVGAITNLNVSKIFGYHPMTLISR